MKTTRRSFMKQTATLSVASSVASSLVMRHLVNAADENYGYSPDCPYSPVLCGLYAVYYKVNTCDFLAQKTERDNIAAFAATLKAMTSAQRHQALLDEGYQVEPPAPRELWDLACMGQTRPATPAEQLSITTKFEAPLLAQAGPPATPAHGFVAGDIASQPDIVAEWDSYYVPRGYPTNMPPLTHPEEPWYFNVGDQDHLTYKSVIEVAQINLIALDCEEIIIPEPLS